MIYVKLINILQFLNIFIFVYFIFSCWGMFANIKNYIPFIVSLVIYISICYIIRKLRDKLIQYVLNKYE